MDSHAARAPFPEAGLMPTDETLAGQFVSEHSEWDGRGVIIAVLDTGVDPAAIGLQTTSDGRPKVVDIVDASGSGDVAMSGEAEGEPGTSVLGMTGRTLQLSDGWTNPSGKWRLGAKKLSELYAGPLKARVSKEEKEETAEAAAAVVANAERELADWRAETGEQAAEAKAVADPAARRRLGELLARLAASKDAAAALSRPAADSEVLDVVAWHDGSTWRAALDTSRTGDMRAAPGMASFREERQFATLDRRSQLSYSLNTYDDGAIVSVVCDAGSHGTHVSGIAAGHHPGSPERSGVAPGAQIVAVKIGDSRLGSMETMQGLMRGVRAVVDNRCDLINLSYGEPTAWPSTSRLMRQIDAAVGTRGVIFITSAGNAGPALSVVGAPAACSSSAIAVGALVSDVMAKAGYAARRGSGLRPYTWSSRGPTMSGRLGVSICAPGGAMASVPVWNLSMAAFYNGTSMASPNACGCVALLLSAAKACGLAYTPHSIRRVLENGASHVEGSDVWSMGRGLLNVPRSWTLMQRGAERAEAEKRSQAEAARRHTGDEAGATDEPWAAPRGAKAGAAASSPSGAAGAVADAGWRGIDAGAPGSDAETLPAWARGVVGASRLRFERDSDMPVACVPTRCAVGEAEGEDWTVPALEVTVPFQGASSGDGADSGVYWREPAQSRAASTVNVSVATVWHPAVHERVRLLFERRYALASTASWVRPAGHVTLSSKGAGFSAHVDPTGLPPGAHYAEIRAYRVRAAGERGGAAIDQGPDFFVPVTVIRPETAVAATSAAPSFRFERLPAGCVTHTSTNDPAAASAAAARSPSSPAAAASAPAAAALRTFALTPGHVERRFVVVPEGCTWAEMVVRRLDDGNDDDSEEAVGAPSPDGPRGRDAAAAAAAASSSWYGSAGIVSGGDDDAGSPDADASRADAQDAGPVRDMSSRIVAMHCMQVVPHTSERKTVKEVYARLCPGEEATMCLAVQPGRVMEAVVAQYWSSLGATLVSATVRFRGVSLPRSIAASPFDGAFRVDVASPAHDVLLRPEASLKDVRVAVAPSAASVDALGTRDRDEAGRQLYRLRLRYDYTCGAAAETVVPVLGGAHHLLYESPHMCQGVYFIDTTPALPGGAPASAALLRAVPGATGVAGAVAGFSDAFGDKVSLLAGRKYAVVAQLVGADRAALDTLSHLVLTVTRPLPAPVKLVARPTLHDAQAPTGAARLGPRKLRRGTTASVFFEIPGPKALPAGLPAGAQLVGTVNMADYSAATTAAKDGRCPGGEAEIVLTLTAPIAAPAAPTASSAASPAAPKSVEDQVHEVVRDASLAALAKLKGEPFDVLYDTLAAESPSHLPLLLAALARRSAEVDPLAPGAGGVAGAASASAGDGDHKAARELVDDIVAGIEAAVSPDEVAAYFSRRYDEAEADAEARARRKTMTERRDALLKALWARVRSRIALVGPAAAAGEAGGAIRHALASAEDDAAFSRSLSALRELEDTGKGEYRLAELEEALRREQPGKALTIVNAVLAGSAADAAKVASPAQLRALRLGAARRVGEDCKGAAAGAWESVVARYCAEDAALRAGNEAVF